MTNTTTIDTTRQTPSGFVTVNEGDLRAHLDQIVAGAVEETLNQLLDAEAAALCQARRYERTAARQDTRAGHYARKLQTRAGEVTLQVPKLRQLTFETAIIERYQRREASVEEALIEMYLAGVSVRRVEDITEALWGTKVSASTVSELNQKLYLRLEDWLARPLTGAFAYVYLDGLSTTPNTPTAYAGLPRVYDEANRWVGWKDTGGNTVGGSQFAYDGEGNPTTYLGQTMAFDRENHLTRVGTTQAPTFQAGYRSDGLRA